MFVNLKPYAAMKNAGVEWLGEVPAHWEALPLCAVATPKSITGQQHRELLSVYLNRGVIRFSEMEEKRTNVTSEDLSKYQAVDPGDFVLNNQQAWRGSVGVSNLSGIVSPAYLVLSLSPGLHTGFANLVFRERVMVTQYLVSSRGVGSIQRNLYWPHLKRVVFPSPPLSEQTAIVRFLDYADRRIRRYIRAKQKLIALLEEQKQAIIHQAVTGQIDVRTGQPYPAYKPSGVEWLREVPEHWDVFRLATICNKITNGYVGPTRDILVSDGVRYLQSLHIKRNQIQFDGKYFVEESWSRAHAKSILMEGDVLVVQTGDIGQVAVVPREFEGSNCHALIILSCRPSYASGQFVSLVLNSNYGFHSLNLIKTGALHPHLNCTFVREIHIALPPLNAQHTIATYLNRETAIIDALIEKIKKAIALLREYRTSLIADVVTGKLDVREAAAALPEVDSRAADDSLDDTFDADAELPLDELDATAEEVEA